MGLNPADLFTSMTKDWRRKRPIWIMLLLNALNEYDTKSRGISVLDTFLIREAASWNKRKGSIESVEEQCDPLNALNNSQVILFNAFVQNSQKIWLLLNDRKFVFLINFYTWMKNRFSFRKDLISLQCTNRGVQTNKWQSENRYFLRHTL